MRRIQKLFQFLLLAGCLFPSAVTQAQSWEKEVWNADEAPFQREEQRVKAELSGLSLNQLHDVYAAYMRQGDAHPKDVMTQFRQARAFSRSLIAGASIINAMMLLQRMETLQPHSYQFARARYLVERASNNYKPDVRQVGRRLLQRDPNDYQVLFYQVNALDTRIPAERRESLACSQRVMQLRPRDWRSYNLMGEHFRKIWFGANLVGEGRNQRWDGQLDQVSRDKAIFYFKKQGQLLPADSPQQKEIQKAISALLQGKTF